MKESDTKTKPPMAKKEISGKLFERVFLPWTAILILSHLLTIYIAPAYMWGVHFYHFSPAWIGWILTLAALAILIPGVGEFLYEKFEALVEKIKRPFAQSPLLARFTISQNKAFLILSLFSLPILWIFRTRLYLLGDGYLRIGDLREGKILIPEWLDGFIHLVVYRMMSKPIPTWTPEFTYSTISILCGSVFVFLSLKLSSLLGKTGFEKTLLFFFLVSLGSIELFFGYVESYSILQVMLLAYIFFAALYLAGKTGIFLALLSFVISVGLHISSLVFAPSFIYLLWESHRRIEGEKLSFSVRDVSAPQGSAKRRKGHLRKESSKTKPILNLPTVVALILSSVVIAFWIHRVATSLEKTGKSIFILPLKATESYRFSMFSLAHISEFINQLLLLSPLGISLMIFFLFFKLKFRSYGSCGEFKDRLTNFLILATTFALIYLFVFNFTLGSADWDLRSSPAPFFGLLGGLLFLRWGEKSYGIQSKEKKPGSEESLVVSSPSGKRFKAWGLIFIWFSLFHTVPWVLINAHHSGSVARYVLIQENDPHPVDESHYNIYKIGRILKYAGLREEEKKLYQRAIEKNPYDTLSYYNLAVDYYEKKDFDQAILILNKLLKVAPLYPKANGMIAELYGRRKEYSKALPHLERALPYFADDADYLYQLAVTYSKTNQMKKAGVCALEVIKLRPDYVKAYQFLGSIYASLGDFESARQVWKHILTIDPGDSIAIRNLKEVEKFIKK
jgi:hypothetical protein